MDTGNVIKIWGERRRILLTEKTEIDYLKLKGNTFCSWHDHIKKRNVFYVLTGRVMIHTEYGDYVLESGQSMEVRPPIKHRFIALEDSEMIEVAYVNDGKIDEADINRKKQGGRIIDGIYISIPELREKGHLEVTDEIS